MKWECNGKVAKCDEVVVCGIWGGARIIWRWCCHRGADGRFVKSKRWSNHAPTRAGDVFDHNLAVNVVVRLICKMPGMNGARLRVSIVDFGSVRGGGSSRTLLVSAVCAEGAGFAVRSAGAATQGLLVPRGALG